MTPRGDSMTVLFPLVIPTRYSLRTERFLGLRLLFIEVHVKTLRYFTKYLQTYYFYNIFIIIFLH